MSVIISAKEEKTDVVEWLKSYTMTISKSLKDSPHTQVIFLKSSSDEDVIIKHKLYYKDNETWMEQTTTRTIPLKETPVWIREKLVGVGLNEEIDATKEFAAQLKIEL